MRRKWTLQLVIKNVSALNGIGKQVGLEVGRKLQGFGPRLHAAETRACLATCGSRCLVRRSAGANIICLSLARKHLIFISIPIMHFSDDCFALWDIGSIDSYSFKRKHWNATRPTGIICIKTNNAVFSSARLCYKAHMVLCIFYVLATGPLTDNAAYCVTYI